MLYAPVLTYASVLCSGTALDCASTGVLVLACAMLLLLLGYCGTVVQRYADIGYGVPDSGRDRGGGYDAYVRRNSGVLRYLIRYLVCYALRYLACYVLRYLVSYVLRRLICYAFCAVSYGTFYVFSYATVYIMLYLYYAIPCAMTYADSICYATLNATFSLSATPPAMLLSFLNMLSAMLPGYGRARY